MIQTNGEMAWQAQPWTRADLWIRTNMHSTYTEMKISINIPRTVIQKKKERRLQKDG